MNPLPRKLRRLVNKSEVNIVDLGEDTDRPGVPPELEDLTLVQGPRIFHWLIERCQGKMRAEALAGVSHSTMSRWVHSKPGQAFGQRHDTQTCRSYSSIWFGYPTPFPGFDRLVEEVFGEDKSFLGVCIERYGLKSTLISLRASRGFGLEMLELTDRQILNASRAVELPGATRRRWLSGVRYPVQWRALDALCMHVLGWSWLETLLWVRPVALPRRVSKEALLCLIEESWELRS